METKRRLLVGAMMLSNAMKVNTKDYDGSQQELAESLGLIPMWIAEYNILGETDLVKWMTERYGFGDLYEFKGTVNEDGSYSSAYEDDEDLPYVGQMKTKDGVVYMYPYAITAIPTKDGYFITRMD